MEPAVHRPGTGQQEGDVVPQPARRQAFHDVVPGLTQRPAEYVRAHQPVRQVAHALVDVPLAAFDQAVGVQGEDASRRQLAFDRLEGPAADPQGRAGAQLDVLHRSVRADHRRGRVGRRSP